MKPLPVLVALGLSLPASMGAGPLVMEPAAVIESKPVHIETIAEWRALPADTTAVSLRLPGRWNKGEFTTVMRALAKEPGIRRIDLKISYFYRRGDPLVVLREFQSLETLNIDDIREGGSTRLLGHVAEMKNLRQASFAFF